MNCTCDCHKQENFSKLKKCEDKNKQKDKKIKELEKKLLTLTVIACIIGTIVGKETVESIADWIDSVNTIKTTIDNVSYIDNNNSINHPGYYGITPAPSTLAIVGLLAFMPVKRRR
tara:strand:+ start:103 stop:450 length:348 start_codon:yes stop_codon:yes gene_type:complete